MKRHSLIWSVTDVEDEKTYRLLLCQSQERIRFFRLAVISSSEGMRIDAPDVKLKTQVVPNDLLRRRDLEAISNAVRLDDGSRYYVDAHGTWLTEAEYQSFVSGGLGSVEWLDGVPPRFNPA